MEWWPGWVNVGDWVHTEIVYLPTTRSPWYNHVTQSIQTGTSTVLRLGLRESATVVQWHVARHAVDQQLFVHGWRIFGLRQVVHVVDLQSIQCQAMLSFRNLLSGNLHTPFSTQHFIMIRRRASVVAFTWQWHSIKTKYSHSCTHHQIAEITEQATSKITVRFHYCPFCCSL